jgi:hypothetical protein
MHIIIRGTQYELSTLLSKKYQQTKIFIYFFKKKLKEFFYFFNLVY